MTTETSFQSLASLADALGLTTWRGLVMTIALAVAAGVSGFAASEALVFLGEMRIKRGQGYKRSLETLKGRVPYVSGFEQRYAQYVQDLQRIDAETEALTARQGQLMSQLRQLRELQSRSVRTIGQPTEGLKRYRALIVNAYVAEFVAQRKHHPLFDDAWARPQIVEVWTTSSAICQFILREKYTKALGFTIDKVELVRADTAADSSAPEVEDERGAVAA